MALIQPSERTDKRSGPRLHAVTSSFSELIRARDKFFLDNPELRESWTDVDGREITAQSFGSAIYAAKENADLDGYFYLTDEKAGFTLYHVALPVWQIAAVSKPKQFAMERDIMELARLFSLRILDADIVADANAKDKGHNAASIQLHKRNISRVGSIQDYREKMKRRQIPLKIGEQWDFFTSMIEDGLLTDKALEQVTRQAAYIAAIRRGDEPAEYDGEEARRIYMETAVKG